LLCYTPPIRHDRPQKGNEKDKTVKPDMPQPNKLPRICYDGKNAD